MTEITLTAIAVLFLVSYAYRVTADATIMLLPMIRTDGDENE